MGSKRKQIKLIIWIVSISLIIFFSIIIHYVLQPTEIDYYNRLFTAFNEHNKITVENIFPFEFEKAYIFDDCYISGEGLTERYNLDISIPQVKSGINENVQRIVFVDQNGSFVYEFRCNLNEIIIAEKGIIIYPETVIEIEKFSERTLILRFKSSEYYTGEDRLTIKSQYPN